MTVVWPTSYPTVQRLKDGKKYTCVSEPFSNIKQARRHAIKIKSRGFIVRILLRNVPIPHSLDKRSRLCFFVMARLKRSKKPLVFPVKLEE
ncbi:MAG: hypothetical protein ACTSUV_01665 [Candidatus Ranarchaeia archaeon]